MMKKADVKNAKKKRISFPENPEKKPVKKSVSKQLTGQRKTIQAHISSRNKRSQTRRDSK